jgi:hypothetical protein
MEPGLINDELGTLTIKLPDVLDSTMVGFDRRLTDRTRY